MQCVFAANLQVDDHFSKERIVLGPSKVIDYKDFLYNYSLEENVMLNPDIEVSIPAWLSINGWEYHPKSVLVSKKSHEMSTSLPEFVQINSLVVQGENILAVATAFESCIFDEHFHEGLSTRSEGVRILNPKMIFSDFSDFFRFFQIF